MRTTACIRRLSEELRCTYEGVSVSSTCTSNVIIEPLTSLVFHAALALLPEPLDASAGQGLGGGGKGNEAYPAAHILQGNGSGTCRRHQALLRSSVQMVSQTHVRIAVV
jgi:hypothetical protein